MANDIIYLRSKSGEARALFVHFGKDTIELVDGLEDLGQWMSVELARAFVGDGDLGESCPFELVLERELGGKPKKPRRSRAQHQDLDWAMRQAMKLKAEEEKKAQAARAQPSRGARRR